MGFKLCRKFQLIVIGTGPAGEKAAVKAAYFGHKVAIVEREASYGGAEVVTGTLPSKTLKETALFLSGKYEKGLYGIERGLEHEASVEDFMYRKNFVSASAAQEIYENLIRHGVSIFHGTASFEDDHTIRINGEKEELIHGEYIIIATGSYPHHPPQSPLTANGSTIPTPFFSLTFSLVPLHRRRRRDRLRIRDDFCDDGHQSLSRQRQGAYPPLRRSRNLHRPRQSDAVRQRGNPLQ